MPIIGRLGCDRVVKTLQSYTLKTEVPSLE